MAKVATQITVSLSDIGVTPTSPNKIDIIELLKSCTGGRNRTCKGFFKNEKCTFQIPTKWPRPN
jgi:hypothetical protein